MWFFVVVFLIMGLFIQKNIWFRVLGIILLLGLSVALVYPSFVNAEYKIILKKATVEADKDKLIRRLKDLKIKNIEVKREDGRYVIYIKEDKGLTIDEYIKSEIKKFKFVKSIEKILTFPERYLFAKPIKRGLDLQGGMYIVLRPDYEKIKEELGREPTDKEKQEYVEKSLGVLMRRINRFGVSEPIIRKLGKDNIEIQLPGIRDRKKAIEVIKKVGNLAYKLVDPTYDDILASKKDFPDIDDEYYEEKLWKYYNKVKKELKLPKDRELHIVLTLGDDKRLHPTGFMVTYKEAVLKGSDIRRAYYTLDENLQDAVGFELTTEGAIKFAKATGEHIGEKLAIILDGYIRSAPVIRTQITGGRAQITGAFTKEEAEALANVINEGSLPVPLKFVEESSIGPSLGERAVKLGFKAGIIGSLLVLLFMIVYYKIAGIFADVSLFINILLILAILSLFDATLTLPGIAGIVLMVGMGVDANVIIFERIKEELRMGKSPRLAIERGFDRAFWTILDANITTLIAAFFLYYFGSGPVKGFAITLMIGIFANIFTALYITKVLFDLYIEIKPNLKKVWI